MFIFVGSQVRLFGLSEGPDAFHVSDELLEFSLVKLVYSSVPLSHGVDISDLGMGEFNPRASSGGVMVFRVTEPR